MHQCCVFWSFHPLLHSSTYSAKCWCGISHNALKAVASAEKSSHINHIYRVSLQYVQLNVFSDAMDLGILWHKQGICWLSYYNILGCLLHVAWNQPSQIHGHLDDFWQWNYSLVRNRLNLQYISTIYLHWKSILVSNYITVQPCISLANYTESWSHNKIVQVLG